MSAKFLEGIGKFQKDLVFAEVFQLSVEKHFESIDIARLDQPLHVADLSARGYGEIAGWDVGAKDCEPTRPSCENRGFIAFADRPYFDRLSWRGGVKWNAQVTPEQIRFFVRENPLREFACEGSEFPAANNQKKPFRLIRITAHVRLPNTLPMSAETRHSPRSLTTRAGASDRSFRRLPIAFQGTQRLVVVLSGSKNYATVDES